MKISNGVNKKIPTPIAIIIISACAILVAGLALWQYLKMPKMEKGIRVSEEETQYSEKINNVESKKLIKIAEDYILTEPEVYFNNSQWIEWSDEKSFGIKLDAAWIISHNPELVEYNPPDKWPAPYSYFNDKYVVRWFFIPGCEERPESTFTPNWFDKYGHQCVGGYVLNVLINSNLEAERVCIDAVR